MVEGFWNFLCGSSGNLFFGRFFKKWPMELLTVIFHHRGLKNDNFEFLNTFSGRVFYVLYAKIEFP